MRRITTIVAMMFIARCAHGQQFLKGKIYDGQTDSVLASVTIFNTTKKKYGLSGRDGGYSIEAYEGDKLVFTAIGYLADTVKVLNFMVDAGYDITLTHKSTTLKNVTIHAPNYQKDSLERREDYSAFYDRPKKKMVSRTGPQNGAGIAISPIGFFAHRSKDKKMEKNLRYQEEQDFVNYSFSRRYVERLTSLHGDSLDFFMLRYRPTYEFCRHASSEDMIHYINDRLIQYKKTGTGLPEKRKE